MFCSWRIKGKRVSVTHNMPHLSSLFGYHTAIQLHTFTFRIAEKAETEILFTTHKLEDHTSGIMMT